MKTKEKKINLKNLDTEKQNKLTSKISSCSSLEIVKLINQQDSLIHKAVAKKSKQISQTINICFNAIKNEGRIIYLGAGTSGRIGILDASEILPTFGVKDKFIGLIAGGENAIRNPVENAEDDIDAVVNDLKAINFNSKDVLIGITASGRTPYVISGIMYGKLLKAITVGISTVSKSKLSEYVDIAIDLNVGPEAITGSTRMKSGTAQKMVLNMISTGTMIKLGKVYGNLMIDVQPTNSKLIQRAKNIIKSITNESESSIEIAFNKANKSVPLTIIMLKKKCELDAAIKIYDSKNFNWKNI